MSIPAHGPRDEMRCSRVWSAAPPTSTGEANLAADERNVNKPLASNDRKYAERVGLGPACGRMIRIGIFAGCLILLTLAVGLLVYGHDHETSFVWSTSRRYELRLIADHVFLFVGPSATEHTKLQFDRKPYYTVSPTLFCFGPPPTSGWWVFGIPSWLTAIGTAACAIASGPRRSRANGPTARGETSTPSTGP